MKASSVTSGAGTIIDGWLAEARRVPSPNFSQRSPACEIDLLVIHNISLPPGQFGTPCIEQFFTNQLDPDAHPYFSTIQGLKVSAHLLIRRDGGLVQFVRFDDRAWHAGLSSFCGRKNCNDYSIGIELEGTDDIPYTMIQYQQLVRVTTVLMQYYPAILPERIAGHSDIAPGRKTDPGGIFDWILYRKLLAGDTGSHSAGDTQPRDTGQGLL